MTSSPPSPAVSGVIPLDGRLLDLESTLLSGQSFRWRRDAKWYCGGVRDAVVKLRAVEDGVEFVSGTGDPYGTPVMLADYLGLSTDLDEVYEALSRDRRCRESIERHPGLRIMRQDPWETVVYFLFAQASNIPRITKNIESLCDAYGAPVSLEGVTRFTFPTPSSLADARESDLRAMGYGYRAKYIVSVARVVAEGRTDLTALRNAPYQEALDVLMTLDGIGDKVANCIMLFALDKLESFPVDVWIQRLLGEWYSDAPGVTLKMTNRRMREWAQGYFGKHAGYANHYLFYDRRLMGRVVSQ